MTDNYGFYVGLHYDMHANEHDIDLFGKLDPADLEKYFRRIKPDFVSCDSKGHPGYTSYPSRFGCTAPGLAKDSLRIYRDVTSKLGIKLYAHFSGVYDKLAIIKNPNWARINADGTSDKCETCNYSGYTSELMIPQMLEILKNYDVDGFWVDGENWASGACWCDKCKSKFVQETGLVVPLSSKDNTWEQWKAFHRKAFVDHVNRYSDAIHKTKPDCTVCSNWMYSSRQPDPITARVDYLSGDIDPAWGCARAALEGRVFDSTDMPWNLMVWLVTKPKPGAGQYANDTEMPWVIKPVVHLCQEVAEVVALGGGTILYDPLPRSGRLPEWHVDITAEVVDFARTRQAFCHKTTTASEIAILYLSEHHYAGSNLPYCLFESITPTKPLEGALHCILENGHSVDVITRHSIGKINEYKLLIVPEQTHIEKDVLRLLEKYVGNGGHVIITGNNLACICPELVGVVAAERPEIIRNDIGVGGCNSFGYLPVGQRAVPVCGDWSKVVAGENTFIEANFLRGQEPERDDTGFPIVTLRKTTGSVLAIHGPIFYNYFSGHYPLIREFIKDQIRKLEINWRFKIDAPPWVEFIARKKGDLLLLNFVNRGCAETLDASRINVVAIPPANNISVEVRINKLPRSVRMRVADTNLPFEFKNGILKFTLPPLDIHEVVEIT